MLLSCNVRCLTNGLPTPGFSKQAQWRAKVVRSEINIVSKSRIDSRKSRLVFDETMQLDYEPTRRCRLGYINPRSAAGDKRSHFVRHGAAFLGHRDSLFDQRSQRPPPTATTTSCSHLTTTAQESGTGLALSINTTTGIMATCAVVMIAT